MMHVILNLLLSILFCTVVIDASVIGKEIITSNEECIASCLIRILPQCEYKNSAGCSIVERMVCSKECGGGRSKRAVSNPNTDTVQTIADSSVDGAPTFQTSGTTTTSGVETSGVSSAIQTSGSTTSGVSSTIQTRATAGGVTISESSSTAVATTETTTSPIFTSGALTSGQLSGRATSGIITSGALTSAPLTSEVITTGTSILGTSTGATSTSEEATTGDNNNLESSSVIAGNAVGSNKPMVIGVSAGTTTIGITLFGAFLIFAIRRRRKNKNNSDDESDEVKEAAVTPVDGATKYAEIPERVSIELVSIKSSAHSTGSIKGSIRDISLEIAYDELDLKDKLGEGAFGVVFKADWRGSPVAEPQVSRNVLTLFGYCLNPLAIVTEYCDSGSLSDRVTQFPQLTSTEILNIVKGIAAGMAHLHYENIVHRDLATRNILLNSNDVKIADFGMSRLVEAEETSNKTQNTLGPIRWMSPESLNDRIYSNKTDVWSFGCLIFEILEKQMPYPGVDLMGVALKVAANQISLINYLTSPEEHPSILVHIMKECLKFSPQERPEFKDILQLLQKN